MKKIGFTLIEMIAVILIMALMTLIVLPTIMNQIQSQKQNISNTALQLIYSANELYLREKEHDYPMYEGATYCVSLESLVNDGKLKSPVEDLKTGKQITLNQIVKTEVNAYGDGEYSLVAPTECKIVYPEIPEDPRDDETLYVEAALYGADPVLKDGLIPVKISSTGIVRRADLNKRWYSYSNREWANAVILKDDTRVYSPGDVIAEENIEAYFVWIPKYKYQLWDLGNYDSLTSNDTSKVHTISIKFGLENTVDSKSGECTTPKTAGESGNCKVGDYMTHPAFIAFNSNGLWIGKFETGYDGAKTIAEAEVNESVTGNIIVKPGVYSWRGISVGNAFKTSYDYMRNLESHMMKNTEWGAVTYLSHSRYGTNKEVSSNDSSYITGYAGTENLYNTNLGYLASTTGNITGIYDMNRGASEYVMGYTTGTSIGEGGNSAITNLYNDFFTNTNWNKYYDTYSSTATTNYNNRILGDATGEMGPFLSSTASWYNDLAKFVNANVPWFDRGGNLNSTPTGAGIFFFNGHAGNGASGLSFRIVLTPTI